MEHPELTYDDICAITARRAKEIGYKAANLEFSAGADDIKADVDTLQAWHDFEETKWPADVDE